MGGPATGRYWRVGLTDLFPCHCEKASRYQRVYELHKRVYEPEA
jgi:hypothetical protein